MSASLRWATECCECSTRSWHVIERYPKNKCGVRKLLKGGVDCPTSCPGSMVLRKYEEKRFMFFYSYVLRSLRSRRFQLDVFEERRTEFMSASASLEWAVECGDCFKRARHKIRRYPECTEDIEELLKGEVLCSSCAGKMHLRKYEEKRFSLVYGALAKKYPGDMTSGHPATLSWPTQCTTCSNTDLETIRKYPHTREDLKRLLSASIECPSSCTGRMLIRKHEEKRFLFVYGTLIRAMGIYVKR
ncbi:hypothetical protein ACHWQZ_G010774 [Mnemiopsis leidyi]